ncbi:barley B recombinant-like protein D [Magnolia sinica]|uniref:barley B recombinant-like protein D n=1 Tax=Magnolia sinica TaxID=86752 RepID=UPI0026584D55|nr:barley B recombinant-like protein D [Magnolia sinica]XP_058098773.1 barley B recombinant-like protein D [Magnolia sinica]XP_058098774.1 barley B recombinant-like protein D [Magnolia sinica]XP_058098775.1 barley B recombinant-like protein D [Magnolia sinica]
MDDGGQRENGRHKADQYKGVHHQWIPQHQMKDPHSLKILALAAERDAAIQERNLAIAEKKAALAERDMAILQRDAALAERNNALMERDSAIGALEYARENAMNGSGPATCPPGCGLPRGTKHVHHPQHMADAHYHPREMHISSEAYPISAATDEAIKPRRAKRPRKETKGQFTTKKTSKARKGKRGGEDLNKQVPGAKQLDWKGQELTGGEDLNKQLSVTKHEWKDQDLGLNQVNFDDSTMPVPVCSCTGLPQQCYKWGNGGWQSACCTTTMSMYPLPVMPNKRHARVGGRKMSGSAFTKLLSRLAAEGHDLSTPLDLKDHWAKHGTNRYITIK